MFENDGDAEQRTLFPIRSDLAVLKEGTGALKVETVLDEIAKLEQLRALGRWCDSCNAQRVMDWPLPRVARLRL
jgi:hypothetical protein